MAKSASSKGKGAPGQPQAADQAIVARRFVFEGTGEVRAVVVDGKPGFVASDVAERLGYANPAKAISDHCKGFPIWKPLKTSGGTQKTRIIFEPDVYALIFTSRLPEAEEFKRWVFDEVLPAIRRTGGYIAAAAHETDEELVLRAVGVLRETVARQKAQIGKQTAQIGELKAVVAEAAPKVLGWERLVDAEGLITIANAARVMGLQQKAVFDFLEHKVCWVFREERKNGTESPVIPKAGPRERGWMVVKLHEYERRDGTKGASKQSYLTMAGAKRLTELAIKHGLITAPQEGGG